MVEESFENVTKLGEKDERPIRERVQERVNEMTFFLVCGGGAQNY